MLNAINGCPTNGTKVEKSSLLHLRHRFRRIQSIVNAYTVSCLQCNNLCKRYPQILSQSAYSLLQAKLFLTFRSVNVFTLRLFFSSRIIIYGKHILRHRAFPVFQLLLALKTSFQLQMFHLIRYFSFMTYRHYFIKFHFMIFITMYKNGKSFNTW